MGGRVSRGSDAQQAYEANNLEKSKLLHTHAAIANGLPEPHSTSGGYIKR